VVIFLSDDPDAVEFQFSRGAVESGSRKKVGDDLFFLRHHLFEKGQIHVIRMVVSGEAEVDIRLKLRSPSVVQIDAEGR
jgi:hypothetical protein